MWRTWRPRMPAASRLAPHPTDATAGCRGLDDQIRPMSLGRVPGKTRSSAEVIERVGALEQAAEHRAVFGEHRPVAILVQRAPLDGHLAPGHATALDAPAKHPVDRAVAVVSAARAVLAEGSAELRDDHHHGARPRRAHLLGETGEAPAEIAEQIGELALGVALVDVGVPATHVDERKIELVRA